MKTTAHLLNSVHLSNIRRALRRRELPWKRGSRDFEPNNPPQLGMLDSSLTIDLKFLISLLSAEEFPIGWYCGAGQPSATDIADMANTGVNIVLKYHRGGPEDALTFLDQVAAEGILGMMEVYPGPPTGGSSSGFYVQQLDPLINAIEGRPELWAWYLVDEPRNNGQMTPPQATLAYNEIKKFDLTRPVAIAFAATDSQTDVATYQNAMDIYMCDLYPIVNGSAEFEGLSGFFQALKSFAVNAGGKPYWPILQACDETAGYRLPTLYEERYMIYAALQAGGTGMFFWMYPYSTQQWRDEVLKVLLAQFKAFAGAFGNGPVGSVNTSDTTTVATLYFDTSAPSMLFDYVLVVVHHDDGHVVTTVTLNDPKINSSTDIINSSDYPLPPVDQSKIDVALGPYEVKLFHFIVPKRVTALL